MRRAANRGAIGGRSLKFGGSWFICDTLRFVHSSDERTVCTVLYIGKRGVASSAHCKYLALLCSDAYLTDAGMTRICDGDPETAL